MQGEVRQGGWWTETDPVLSPGLRTGTKQKVELNQVVRGIREINSWGFNSAKRCLC